MYQFYHLTRHIFVSKPIAYFEYHKKDCLFADIPRYAYSDAARTSGDDALRSKDSQQQTACYRLAFRLIILQHDIEIDRILHEWTQKGLQLLMFNPMLLQSHTKTILQLMCKLLLSFEMALLSQTIITSCMIRVCKATKLISWEFSENSFVIFKQ